MNKILLGVLPSLIIAMAAQADNRVRLVNMPLQPDIYPSHRNADMIQAAQRNVSGSSGALMSSELIAWAVIADRRPSLPYVYEQTIVLLHLEADGTNKWVVMTLEHKLSEPYHGPDSWTVFFIPRSVQQRPTMEYCEFANSPSDEQLVSFITSSDFGYNCCWPNKVTLHVALYRQSLKLEEALKTGIADVEKQKRYQLLKRAYVDNYLDPKKVGE